MTTSYNGRLNLNWMKGLPHWSGKQKAKFSINRETLMKM